MKVKFLFGPKSGTTELTDNETGKTLIAAGLAEEIKYKDFRERLREEGQGRQQLDPNFVNGVQWCVKERTFSTGPNRAYIERRSGQEVLYGESPDAFKDCPQSVRVQFLRLNKVEDPEAIAERQIQENYRLQAEQKAQRERETAGLYRITGGQK